MPQLSIETFVTQYFWLVVIFFAFYFISAAIILPKIATIIKTRNKLSSVSSTSDISESSNTVLGKSILSQAFSFKSITLPQSANYSTIFKKVNKNWVKKFKKSTKKAGTTGLNSTKKSNKKV
jgi:hypothetical protein